MVLKTLENCVKQVHTEKFACLSINGKTVLFLFTPYLPYNEATLENAEVDAYYVVSNESYSKCRKLAALLTENGLPADVYKEKDVKGLAQRVAGSFGKNNLLFVDGYGSFHCIGAVVLEGQFEKLLPQVKMPCDKCLKCVNACPTGALTENGFIREKCMRHWQDYPSEMPAEVREKNGNRLLGCNICQTVCPLNSKERAGMPQELSALLQLDTLCEKCDDKGFLTELGMYIGKNYAKAGRICKMAKIILNEARKIC